MLENSLRWLGRHSLTVVRAAGQIFLLLGRSITYMRHLPTDRALYIRQMYRLGVRSLPLVGVIAIFAGAVAGWQGAYQLKGTLPANFLGTVVATGILIEMGPVLTALVLAGRNGSSIAAEIASMVVTEQVDALEAMAISPVRYLVTPRIVSMTLLMPLLVLAADLIAIFSGAFVVNQFFNINYNTFFNSFQAHFVMSSDFYPGMFKAVMFGLTTGLVSCWVGLRAEHGASGVGRSAIDAFVWASILILISDYVVATIVF